MLVTWSDLYLWGEWIGEGNRGSKKKPSEEGIAVAQGEVIVE